MYRYDITVKARQQYLTASAPIYTAFPVDLSEKVRGRREEGASGHYTSHYKDPRDTITTRVAIPTEVPPA